MKNVLVFPCGSEIGLEVNRSLKYSKHFKVFGASSIDDHGKFEFENYISGIPNVDSEDFIQKINQLCILFDIKYIIPAHDSVVLKLAKYAMEISATIITSPYETCRICRSKSETYKTFNGILPIPKTYNIYEDITFPVFLKPDVGQGSKGTYTVNSYEDMHYYVRKDKTLLPLEYLPGKEYTIDCFTNYNGELIFCEGRQRRRINNGISVNSKLVTNPKFKELGELINNKLTMNGAWFFQVKESVNGELVLMEIAPRIAGTMELFRNMGINFVQLSLFNAMGIDVSIIKNNIDLEIDRALYAKFKLNYGYRHVYIDFDDTIIINNKVNPNMMKFIYHCHNTRKYIHLLTKHKADIKRALQYHFIPEYLFDSITQIQQSEDKSDFIKYIEESIFIDDSFSERKKVSDKLGIPVFDVDAIDCLM